MKRAQPGAHHAGAVNLLAELIKVCVPASVVLDPFTGSGSTGVAALEPATTSSASEQPSTTPPSRGNDSPRCSHR